MLLAVRPTDDPSASGRCGSKSKISILAVACGVMFLALPGCSAEPEYEAPQKFVVSSASATKAVRQIMEDKDLAVAPSAACDGRATCSITYTIEESLGVSTNIEYIEPTRQIWATLFKDPKFKSGVITVSGPTETAGGKSGTSKIFTLSCDREADDQIDWDNVRGKGIRQLCDFEPLVQGL